MFAGRLIPSLRKRLSLSADLVSVVAAHRQPLLFDVPCRVHRTAVTLFLPSTIFSALRALYREHHYTIFLHVFVSVLALSAPSFAQPNKAFTAKALFVIALWAQH